MNRLRFNVLANMAGQGWSIVLALVCTPFYIRLLGVEAYGLIAFFLILQNLLALLDFGVGAALNREIARSSAVASKEIGTLAATAELWYWSIGAGVGAALFFALPDLANWWLTVKTLNRGDVTASAHIFALIALLQWPSSFYGAGLAGLQKQVRLNLIQMPFSTLSNIGGLIFVWLGPRSVAALLAWQAGTLALQLLALRSYFWPAIGSRPQRARVEWALLRKHWRFSLGVSGISLFGLLLTYVDKAILSRLLQLDVFAHYTLAGTLSRGLYVLITPVFAAYFPRLSMLVAQGNKDALRDCYHTGNQAIAALILPLAAVIALFPSEVLFLWLRDRALAAEIAPLAAILVLGVCMNGLMNVPFALQLAHGNTRIGLFISAGLAAVLVPSIIVATVKFGPLGAATMWFAVNASYLLIGLPLTHGLLMKGESKHWLFRDVLPPLFASAAVVITARYVLPPAGSILAGVAAMAGLWALATLCAVLSCRSLRAWAYSVLRHHL